MNETGWVFLVLGGIANIITGTFHLVYLMAESIGGFQIAYILSSVLMIIGILLIASGYFKNKTGGKEAHLFPQTEDENK
jgi:low temperature requirement protein LtrA